MSDPWFVLKFGGTSVARSEGWEIILRRTRELLDGNRVWIVLSALSEVSNRLDLAIEEALRDAGRESLRWIREAHRTLADEVGVTRRECGPVDELLDELDRLLEGIRLTREVSPRLRARVMSFGEMASTRLGVAILARAGLEPAWVDARQLLHSSPRPHEQEATRYLEAEIRPRRDLDRVDAAAGGARLVVTQGFVAGTPRGETCLLGRGGSDTSAALFAALAGASRLEVWTDVHGMFSADPRQIPSARLVRRIGYREAEELAAMGAKVLHPRCLGPVAWGRIPLLIRNTQDPDAEGTRISENEEGDPAVTAVVCRRNVTLVTVSTLEMWGASGFLARTFAPFEESGISVDLVATSQSAVSVTLDRIPGGIDGDPFGSLIGSLERMGRVQVLRSCAVVSIVGRKIRTVLHELGPAMSVFREHEVHMVSESSEDLNLSFVVDEADAAPLVENLHARLFPPQTEDARDPRFGPTWEMLQVGLGRRRHEDAGRPSPRTIPAAGDRKWWIENRAELLDRASNGHAHYVYHGGTAAERARELRRGLPSVDRFYYSMKANSHPRLLRIILAEGFALECVSAAELARARELFGPDVPLLFTPNFCPIEEYAEALAAGAEVTIDGPELFDLCPALLAGREVALRIDPGGGMGHHRHVRTAGAQAKFGHPASDVERAIEAAGRHDVRVVGLHAHVGSGILDPDVWSRTGALLADLRGVVADLRWIDVGGGFGVTERPGQDPLDLKRVETGMAELRARLAGIELRIEPGRYVVSECGVLLAPVTQVRLKGGVRFIGVATGMNSLLRPALYGAWHAIHNLTRLGEPPAEYAHVVGPICESGDVLGRDRLLPHTVPGDVLLIENCGAYGAVMASNYNLRPPAEETVLE